MKTTKTRTAKTSVSLNEIEKFLGSRKIAIAGASRNQKKFGGSVLTKLKNKGFEVYPVNPNADEIQGLKCYSSVDGVPDEVKHLLIVTPRKETAKIVKEAIRKRMEMIWIQQMSETPEAIRDIMEAGIPLIHKKCILMFVDPIIGPHQLHRFFVKLFGKYPKPAKNE
jgi:uncharacterized protein